MPGVSKRRRFLDSLSDLFKIRIRFRALRYMDDSDEDSLEDTKDIVVARMFNAGNLRRCLFRKSKYRKGADQFLIDLQEEELPDESADDELSSIEEEAGQMPWLTDDEFLQKYRCTRESFGQILRLIEDHPVFGRDTTRRGRKQAPPSHQLMVFLKFVGTEGSGASNANQRHTFHIGYGTSEKYRKRVTQALLSLRDEYVFWPNAEERRKIAREIHTTYQFPHCVGIGDGTLFPLAFEPQTTDRGCT